MLGVGVRLVRGEEQSMGMQANAAAKEGVLSLAERQNLL